MIQTRLLLSVVIMLSVSVVSSAEDSFPGTSRQGFSSAPEILPVDDAFSFGFYAETNSVKAFWQVMPGYYLYRDKFQFTRDDVEYTVTLPRGEKRMDEIFGEVEVLVGLVEVELPGDLPIIVSYQGCADRGYCYPPQKKLLTSSNESTSTRK
jgi:thiol:disulfide interchange protein DsbD